MVTGAFKTSYLIHFSEEGLVLLFYLQIFCFALGAVNVYFYAPSPSAPGPVGTYTAACITFMSGGRESAYRLGIIQDIKAPTTWNQPEQPSWTKIASTTVEIEIPSSLIQCLKCLSKRSK